MLGRIPGSIVCLLFLFVCLAKQVSGQVNTGSLTGLVTDPQGAVVPGAVVKVKNQATNVETSVTSDSSGYYTFPTLPVGAYTVAVERQGFKKAVQEKVELEVGQKARLDFALEVGAVSESVVVAAAPPLLTTQEASPGGVLENRAITDLPLSARNWDDLIGGIPGVKADRYTEQGGGTANGRTGGANIHGVRSLQNNFVLDGVDNNSISENVQELTTQVARPSVDAIAEFKVSTNPYTAENGRSPGSLISVTTKGGTNAFRGSAYEYIRNKVFDARDYFNARNAAANPSSPFSKKP